MEAIWSQNLAPPGLVSTGCPIWTPSSIGMAGTIEAIAEKRLTSPTTHRGGQRIWPWSTGSHCGGYATGCSTSAGSLATPGLLVMCGMKRLQKTAVTPMRVSAR